MMFGKKGLLPVAGGASVVLAQAFNAELVLGAYIGVIDAMTNGMSGGTSGVITVRKGKEGPHLWPDPARMTIPTMWRQHAALYGATGEKMRHAFRNGPVVCNAYVMGRQWLVQHPATREVRTNLGYPAEKLDTTPVLEFYERDEPGGVHVGLTRKMASKVSDTIAEHAKMLRLVTVATAVAQEGGTRIVLELRFPSEHYGTGVEWMRVVCATPQGDLAPDDPVRQ